MLPFSRKNISYEEFTDKAHDEKSVWHHFLRAPDKQSAKCKKCKKELKCTGGSTTGLHKHLRSAHVLVLAEPKFEEPKPTTSSQSGDVSKAETLSLESPPPLKKTKLTEYFQSNNTVEARVARMVCLDGIAISKFCTSADLRELFYNSKLKLHRSPNSIKKMVVEYAVNVQKALRVEITTLKAKGCKFSLTFDEWTSSKNRRYINLNVHSEDLGKSKFRNLGLIRIYGSMPAEKCIELLDQRLSIYKLSLSEDIIGITTDGASVMAKVGRILNVFHQLCFAHGIQLAVLDVLYKKVQTATDIEEPQVNCDDDSDTENDEGGFEVLNSAVPLPPNDLKDENIREIINKVRAVTSLFRNSPTKNDILQKYVKDEFGREMSMTRDCKTRWSSMADMLKRFLVIKNCVSKALIDIQSHIKFSENDFQILEAVEKSLDIVKSTVEVLCRREANLHTAETAIKFMIRKLKQQKTSLSMDVVDALTKRIKQRRILASSIIMYLHNPHDYYSNSGEDTTFYKHTVAEITDGIVSIHQTHHQLQDEDKSQPEVDNVFDYDKGNDSDSDAKQLTVSEELENELKNSLVSASEKTKNQKISEIKNVISVEMALYENGGNRGKYLDLAYKYLSSIPPTSVEAERAFSSAGYFCNKIRSSFSDSTLDSLCFLRSHFQLQK